MQPDYVPIRQIARPAVAKQRGKAVEVVDPRLRLQLCDAVGHRKLTHYLFRFPAKFHPPVVAALFERYTKPGQVVLDPLAVAVAAGKTRHYDIVEAGRLVDRLLDALEPLDRGSDAYAALALHDISEVELNSSVKREKLWVPAIPNLEHWFRRYVILDLARIHRQVRRRRGGAAERDFLALLFASVIRNASNADPVPVSGLEVTAHMRRLDEAGRIVDPFRLMRRALSRGLVAAQEWSDALGDRSSPTVLVGDATAEVPGLPPTVDAVITSPPYHNAVDYYRRHQLEMYWLGLTPTHHDRLALLPRYIGRPRIPQSHPLLREPWPTDGLAAEWEREIAAVSRRRAVDFRHYMLAMSRTMRRLASRTKLGAPVVMVIGQSAWNGAQIPTAALFEEIAGPWFACDETLWYPVRNRYMSYARHNGANIDREHVVALRRTDAPVASLA